jgi:hypothetical protein
MLEEYYEDVESFYQRNEDNKTKLERKYICEFDDSLNEVIEKK